MGLVSVNNYDLFHFIVIMCLPSIADKNKIELHAEGEESYSHDTILNHLKERGKVLEISFKAQHKYRKNAYGSTL